MFQRLAIIALISIAGCGWANPPANLQNASQGQAVGPNVGQRYLYLGLNTGTGPTLIVYPLDGSKPLRKIVDSWRVSDLAVDRWGDVYTSDDNPSGGEVTAYTSGGRALLFSMYAGGVSCMTFDARGDLYACQDEYIEEYAPRSSKRIRLGRDALNVWAIALDRTGNVYAAQLTGKSSESSGVVKVFHPRAQRPFRIIHRGISNPTALAFDSSGDLYVANCAACWSEEGTGSVAEYAPGSDTPLRVLKHGINSPTALGIGPGDELFVANNIEFVSKSYKPSAWISVYGPSGRSPKHRITGTFDNVGGMTLDAQGNLYAICSGKGKQEVAVFNQRYERVRTITDGVKGAQAIAIGP
jgi:hypothetical protein